MRLEVIAEENETGDDRAILNVAARGMKMEAVPRGHSATWPKGRILRLALLTKAAAQASPFEDSSSKAADILPRSPHPMAPSVLTGDLDFQSVQVLATWLKRFQKTVKLQRTAENTVRVKASQSQETEDEQRLPLEVNRSETKDARRKDRPRETSESTGLSTFQLDGRPMMMKLQWGPSGVKGNASERQVTAVFLLDLEQDGPVRVDVKLVRRHLQVGFFVANEAIRDRMMAALPDLSATLSPLTTHRYCFVEVSPAKIQEFFAETQRPVADRLDIQA